MSTITLWLNGLALQMPGVTAAGYAAARCAESLGLDPQEGPYHIQIDGKLLPPDAVIADYDGKEIEYLMRGERSDYT